MASWRPRKRSPRVGAAGPAPSGGAGGGAGAAATAREVRWAWGLSGGGGGGRVLGKERKGRCGDAMEKDGRRAVTVGGVAE